MRDEYDGLRKAKQKMNLEKVSEEKLTAALCKWFKQLSAFEKGIAPLLERAQDPQSLLLQQLRKGSSLADLNDSSLSMEDTARALAEVSPTFAALASYDPHVHLIVDNSVLDEKLKNLDTRRAIGLV